MKTLIALAALALGITTASHAASTGTTSNFARVDAPGVTVLLPGQATKAAFNTDSCARTDYHYSPKGYDYRLSVATCSVQPSSDYVKVVESTQRSSKAVRIVENKEMTFDGLTGRFTQFENSDGMTIFFWIATRGNRVYQLIAVHEKGISFDNDAKIMFESVRFSNN